MCQDMYVVKLTFLLFKDGLQLTIRKTGKWTAIELNGAIVRSNFKIHTGCIEVLIC